MTKFFIASGACLIVFGCAAQPAAQPVAQAVAQAAPSANETAHLKEQISKLQSQVSTLENRVGHLQSDFEFSSADNEFTTMAVDSVCWSDDMTSKSFGGKRVLLLHPAEWRGYGKMKRFTDKSDHILYLEAEGKPRLEADVAVGGICNSDGSTRYVIAYPRDPLEPGVSYRIVPRNDNDKYKWSAPDVLVVSASTPTR